MSLELFRVDGGLEIDGSIQITEGTGAPSHDAPIGSTYHRTDAPSGVYYKAASGAGAGNWELQSSKSYVDSVVTTLGSAFNYVGLLAGGAQSTPYDMATLPAAGKDAGDYYKVSTAGWFVVGAGTAFYANLNDGLVWNLTGTVDKIDNTDSTITGTPGHTTVTGSIDTGYTIDLDSTFTTSVTNVISGLAAEVTTRANADTTLQANIDAEITARANADITLQANIDAEATTRANADTTLQANIDAEATARANADTTLQNNINAEATTRANADTTLQTNLTTLSTFVDYDGHKTTGSGVLTLADTVTGAKMVKWIVYVQEVGTPANVNAFEVFATTDGSTVDFNRSGILKLGSPISGLNVACTLPSGNIMLTVSAGNNCNFVIKRVAAAA